jgi:hypothetical protein
MGIYCVLLFGVERDEGRCESHHATPWPGVRMTPIRSRCASITGLKLSGAHARPHLSFTGRIKSPAAGAMPISTGKSDGSDLHPPWRGQRDFLGNVADIMSAFSVTRPASALESGSRNYPSRQVHRTLSSTHGFSPSIAGEPRRESAHLAADYHIRESHSSVFTGER